MAATLIRKKNKTSKIRKRTKKHTLGRFMDKYKTLFILLWILIAIILIIVVILSVLKYTILSQKHTIKEVVYSQSSISVYDNPQIYKDITQELIDKNYYITKRFGMDELHEAIISKHNIIKSIAIAQKGDNILYVEVVFNEPNLVFWTPVNKFALYQEKFYDLNSGNNLGNQAIDISLPSYTSGYPDLNGILYKIDETRLFTMLTTISETLGTQHIESLNYLPGGGKLIVVYKSKTIYFHLDKDINIQLAKIIDLENFYKGFGELTVIDAGSMDDIIAR